MSIKRNTAYNIAGALAPLVSTILLVPPYLHVVGTARFGVLSLVWLLFGYFGLFDLGLSTATANALAKAREGPRARRSSIFVTSLMINVALGCTVGAVIFLLGPTLLASLSMDRSIRGEVGDALPWLALLCPFVTAGGVFNGVLTSHERFLTSNLLSTVGTVLTQVAPLGVALLIGPGLGPIVLATVIVRAAMVVATGGLAVLVVPLAPGRFDGRLLRELLAYGGWVMVTNLVSPILASADQFVIASRLGATAVAHYSIAFSLAARVLIIPGAFVQTLFPVMSRLEGVDAGELARRAGAAMMMVMTTISVPLILVTGPFLGWWLGAKIAAPVTPVAQVLLVSTWINGLAYIPFSLLQAQGRPRRVAQFHVIEVVPFLVALFVGIHFLGLIGAALAWAARVALDAVLLFGAARLLPGSVLRCSTMGLLLVGSCAIGRFGNGHPVVMLVLALTAGSALVLAGITVDPLLREWAGSMIQKIWPRRRMT